MPNVGADPIRFVPRLEIDAPAAMAESAKSYPFVKFFKLKVSGDEKDRRRARASRHRSPARR